MDWKFSTVPQPGFSETWDDAHWPPKQWYEMLDSATGRALYQWEWDNLAKSRAVATQMTQEQFELWAVQQVVGSVCNGGFGALLYNSYGELAEECVLGLRRFELRNYAEIVDEALDLMGPRPMPRDRTERDMRWGVIDRANELAQNTASRTEDASLRVATIAQRLDTLATQLFRLMQAKTHGEGHDAAFYRPLSEWIYAHRDRFYVIAPEVKPTSPVNGLQAVFGRFRSKG